MGTQLENSDQSTSQISRSQLIAGRGDVSTVSSERKMVSAMWAALALALVSTTSGSCIRPYVTCVGCETFMECFLTCPVADYPGVNKFGVYIPKFIRDLGNSFDSEVRRNYQNNIHNTYKNWRAFDPEPFKNYYKNLLRKKRGIFLNRLHT